MKEKRNSAYSLQLNATTLWLMGGFDSDYEDLNSTEMLTIDGSVTGPQLPMKLNIDIDALSTKY